MQTPKYVLITPARNEEAYIEKTIEAVCSQTISPQKWIIVDDGSTDETSNIIEKYTVQYDFIELLILSKKLKRDFSSKVHAFNAGYEKIKRLNFEFIGNLDADIAFDQYYYERVLEKFNADGKLGIAGGTRFDVYNGTYKEIPRSLNSVMGAVQLFRRVCFQDVGGYLPLEGGGIDAVAEIMARMHGWEVRTFPEIKAYHYRRTGTASGNLVAAWFRDGRSDYLIGYHPIFELLRCIQKIFRQPSDSSRALSLLAGYYWAFFRREKRKVPAEVVRYLRSEQMRRLVSLVLPVEDQKV